MKHANTDDVTVVDFGAHFYPPEMEAPEQDLDKTSNDQFAGVDRKSDPETVLAEMDAAGVDAMVYSNTDYMGHDDADETVEANDVLFEYIEDHEEFYGLGSIPIGDNGEAAAAEFERALDMGFQGGALHETEVELTDAEMEPVLEVAEQTGAPIFVHIPNLPNVEYRHNAIFHREYAHQKSISRTIHDGVFDRYPDLNLVWHHLGGNIASMMGRVQLHTDDGRWALQDTMKDFPEFKAQFEERVHVDTCGFFGYTAPIRVALEELSSENVLFGTDYPWEPRSEAELEWLVDSVLESGTHADAKQILGGNALDLMVNT
jgi:predicted TIM-barrel fold metal-dependent hydrolase